MIALDAVRKEWQNSFRQGNASMLAYIEADSFAATVDLRVEGKPERLDKIKRQMRLGRWVESGLVHTETVVMHEEGQYTVFEGLADTHKDGRLLRQSRFKETWCIEQGRWRILALTCTTLL